MLPAVCPQRGEQGTGEREDPLGKREEEEERAAQWKAEKEPSQA